MNATLIKDENDVHPIRPITRDSVHYSWNSWSLKERKILPFPCYDRSTQKHAVVHALSESEGCCGGSHLLNIKNI